MKKKTDFINSHSVLKLNKTKRTMGIDQSLTSTGLTILDKNGDVIHSMLIITTNKNSTEERINFITKNIFDLVDYFEIKQISLEGLSYMSNSTSSRQLAGLFYSLTCKMETEKIPFIVTPPKSLKKETTGSGNASKEEMVAAIPLRILKNLEEITGLKHTQKKFFDIADSYWLAKKITS